MMIRGHILIEGLRKEMESIVSMSSLSKEIKHMEYRLRKRDILDLSKLSSKKSSNLMTSCLSNTILKLSYDFSLAYKF